MSRRIRVSAAGLLAVLVLIVGQPIPVASAADDGVVTFERPSARVDRFSVYWTERFRSPTKPTRVELMTRLVGQEAWLVEDASFSKLEGRDRFGAQVYGGSTYPPNAQIEYRFRVTPKGGTPETGPTRVVTIEDDRIDWKTLKGDLVQLHWQSGDEDFAERALRIAEDAISRTSKLLGVTETEPIDFFVYSDSDDFQSALGPGTKEFVAGRSINEIRTLFAEITPSQIGSDWVSVVIPHELVHLVFDTATKNAYHQPPHWMNEGLAVYLSEGYNDTDRRRVANAVARDALLPLGVLADGFPASREELFYLGYAEGASAIDFFVRTYGQDKLIQLIRGYAAGVTDDEAFRSATGADFQAFEQAWLEDLGTSSPEAVGPQDARPGPRPAAWVSDELPRPSPGASDVPAQGGSPAAPAPALDDPPLSLVVGAGLLVVGGVALVALVVMRRRQRPGHVLAAATQPSTWAIEPPPPQVTEEPAEQDLMSAAEGGPAAEHAGAPVAAPVASDAPPGEGSPPRDGSPPADGSPPDVDVSAPGGSPTDTR